MTYFPMHLLSTKVKNQSSQELRRNSMSLSMRTMIPGDQRARCKETVAVCSLSFQKGYNCVPQEL